MNRMTKRTEEGTAERTFDLMDAVRVLAADTMEVRRSPGEGLTLRCPEHGEKRCVSVEPAFPLTHWGRFIVLRDEDGEELGVIDDLRDLPDGSRRAVEEELSDRHFLPVITRVISISREFHVPIWEVETDRGPRRFACKGRHSAQRMGRGRIYVRDAEGNGYLIPDVKELDRASRQAIDTNL
jgi:hypothetical protein